MKKLNLKHFAITIVLVAVLLFGASCDYFSDFNFDFLSTPTVTETIAPPTTTPAPINPTYTLPSTTTTPPVTTTPKPTIAPSPLPSIADVVAKVKPSVVAIDTELATYDIFGRPITEEGAGSGWIIDSNGLIVTNNHVVEGAKTVTVTLEGGQTYTAKTIRTDPANDLAVIDIGIANLPAVIIGDSSKLRVGDWVVAIGNALGQGIRATEGIISNTGITVTVDTGTTLYNLLETTAAINPGNSGGPLVNMAGEVIGITSAKLSAIGIEGTGYAISSNLAKPIIEQLITKGYATRPLLGVNVSPITQSLVRQYGITATKGAVLTVVSSGGPADKAGLSPGDVVISFAGKTINTADDLVQAIRISQIGQQVEITYYRGSTQAATSVILIESPPGA